MKAPRLGFATFDGESVAVVKRTMADNALESAAAAMTYQHFEDVCGPQLFGSSVPRELWVSIFDKLRNSTLDAGAAFGFAPVDDDDTEGDGVLCLCATADLEPLPSSV